MFEDDPTKIYINVPDEVDGVRFKEQIDTVLKPSAHPAVRTIAKIPEFFSLFHKNYPVAGGKGANRIILTFDKPVSPNLCRIVGDILDRELGVTREDFNACNTSVLSGRAAAGEQGTRTR